MKEVRTSVFLCMCQGPHQARPSMYEDSQAGMEMLLPHKKQTSKLTLADTPMCVCILNIHVVHSNVCVCVYSVRTNH